MDMARQIEREPEWLPHSFDGETGRIMFVRFDRAAAGHHGFLVATPAQPSAWVELDAVMAMQPVPGPAGLIFHSGFCRSTLLLRALSVAGHTATLNEPEIFNSLARTAAPDPALVRQVLALLSRPAFSGAVTIIKPSNFPNRLIPDLLAARPDIPVIIITNHLHEYLGAIVRKGLAGRQWGRQAFLVAADYTGEAGPFRDLAAGLTDLQLGALGWLLTQNWLLRCATGSDRQRVRVLHSAYFDQNRASTIKAASAHFGLTLDDHNVRTIVDGPAFTLDAKTGRDFRTKSAADEASSRSAVTDDEIAEVSDWIAGIARASGLEVPLSQTLL